MLTVDVIPQTVTVPSAFTLPVVLRNSSVAGFSAADNSEPSAAYRDSGGFLTAPSIVCVSNSESDRSRAETMRAISRRLAKLEEVLAPVGESAQNHAHDAPARVAHRDANPHRSWRGWMDFCVTHSCWERN